MCTSLKNNTTTSFPPFSTTNPTGTFTNNPTSPLLSRRLDEPIFGPTPFSAESSFCSCYDPGDIPNFQIGIDYTAEFQYIGFDGIGTNTVLLKAGQTTSLRVIGTMYDKNVDCPGCIAQFYIRGDNVNHCLGSNTDRIDFDERIMFFATSGPGVYEFYTDWS